jgi:hypothetical protein
VSVFDEVDAGQHRARRLAALVVCLEVAQRSERPAPFISATLPARAPAGVLSGAMSAGYSGTPLDRKLGIKPGHRVALLGAPDGFDLAVPGGVTIKRRAGGKADVIVSFHTRRAELERRLPALRAMMEPAAGLWIAWPKKAAKLDTDMTEDVVREIALPTGLVDNKVCAIDTTWSGLRLVIRLRER